MKIKGLQLKKALVLGMVGICASFFLNCLESSAMRGGSANKQASCSGMNGRTGNVDKSESLKRNVGMSKSRRAVGESKSKKEVKNRVANVGSYLRKSVNCGNENKAFTGPKLSSRIKESWRFVGKDEPKKAFMDGIVNVHDYLGKTLKRGKESKGFTGTKIFSRTKDNLYTVGESKSKKVSMNGVANENRETKKNSSMPNSLSKSAANINMARALKNGRFVVGNIAEKEAKNGVTNVGNCLRKSVNCGKESKDLIGTRMFSRTMDNWHTVGVSKSKKNSSSSNSLSKSVTNINRTRALKNGCVVVGNIAEKEARKGVANVGNSLKKSVNCGKESKYLAGTRMFSRTMDNWRIVGENKTKKVPMNGVVNENRGMKKCSSLSNSLSKGVTGVNKTRTLKNGHIIMGSGATKEEVKNERKNVSRSLTKLNSNNKGNNKNLEKLSEKFETNDFLNELKLDDVLLVEDNLFEHCDDNLCEMEVDKELKTSTEKKGSVNDEAKVENESEKGEEKSGNLVTIGPAYDENDIKLENVEQEHRESDEELKESMKKESMEKENVNDEAKVENKLEQGERKSENLVTMGQAYNEDDELLVSGDFSKYDAGGALTTEVDEELKINTEKKESVNDEAKVENESEQGEGKSENSKIIGRAYNEDDIKITSIKQDHKGEGDEELKESMKKETACGIEVDFLSNLEMNDDLLVDSNNGMLKCDVEGLLETEGDEELEDSTGKKESAGAEDKSEKMDNNG